MKKKYSIPETSFSELLSGQVLCGSATIPSTDGGIESWITGSDGDWDL